MRATALLNSRAGGDVHAASAPAPPPASSFCLPLIAPCIAFTKCAVRHELAGDLGEDLLAARLQPVEQSLVVRSSGAPFRPDRPHARIRRPLAVRTGGLTRARTSASSSALGESCRNSRARRSPPPGARSRTRWRRSRPPTAARAARSRRGRAPCRTPARTCCAGTACGSACAVSGRRMGRPRMPHVVAHVVDRLAPFAVDAEDRAQLLERRSRASARPSGAEQPPCTRGRVTLRVRVGSDQAHVDLQLLRG